METLAQKFSLYATLTVRENLAFYGAAYGLHGRQLTERMQAMLKRFDLDPEAESGLLPAGYRQRLAMAAGPVAKRPFDGTMPDGLSHETRWLFSA